MQLTKRINLKLFIPLSLSFTGLALYFSNSAFEAMVITCIYLATLINLGLLLGVMSKIVEIASSVEPVEYSKINMTLVFVGKIIIIFLGLSLGVHFMGKRVIIPLLNYVIQIFVLGVSFKRSK
jgi:flagellar biosynthesis protein FliQ